MPRGAIRLLLARVLEQELHDAIGARRYERMGSRNEHRNGTYIRRLLTRMGLNKVAVPRIRLHNGG